MLKVGCAIDALGDLSSRECVTGNYQHPANLAGEPSYSWRIGGGYELGVSI